MFIRHYFKHENGQRAAYWALVESYRAANGPRQRVVAWLGQLDEAGRLGVLRAAEEANVADWSDEDLWKAYIQLTEAEAAFRIHKSDLSLCPIWHQKEDRVFRPPG